MPDADLRRPTLLGRRSCRSRRARAPASRSGVPLANRRLWHGAREPRVARGPRRRRLNSAIATPGAGRTRSGWFRPLRSRYVRRALAWGDLRGVLSRVQDQGTPAGRDRPVGGPRRTAHREVSDALSELSWLSPHRLHRPERATTRGVPALRCTPRRSCAPFPAGPNPSTIGRGRSAAGSQPPCGWQVAGPPEEPTGPPTLP